MSVLSANQKNVLSLLAAEPALVDHFYLSGGTALSEFYLHHRYSEDLDFFSEQEVDPQAVSTILKRIQGRARIDSFTYEQSFNRNLFFLHINEDVIKTEFTYFPFTPIEQGKTMNALRIDSLLDIAVNKIFTIYQKPRARDFVDLFCIARKNPAWSVVSLMQHARVKFDHHLEPLQMAAQFLKSEDATDYPRMIVALDPGEWRSFYRAEAKKLAEGIVV